MLSKKKGRTVTVEEVQKRVHFCSNWKGLVKAIEEYASIGVTSVAIVTGGDKKLIRDVAKNVLDVF